MVAMIDAASASPRTGSGQDSFAALSIAASIAPRSPEQYWLRQRIPEHVSVGVPCVRSAMEVRRIGAWLGALETGRLPPSTALQIQFVDVCAGRLPAQTRVELDWETYMLRRFSDRKQVCVCSNPDQKCCEYETGWKFRAQRICVRCGWALPRRTGRPPGRKWRRIATDALNETPWFMTLALEFEARHPSTPACETELLRRMERGP
jgi:uncharacterized protein YifE (UPF0438 family)